MVIVIIATIVVAYLVMGVGCWVLFCAIEEEFTPPFEKSTYDRTDNKFMRPFIVLCWLPLLLFLGVTTAWSGLMNKLRPDN